MDQKKKEKHWCFLTGQNDARLFEAATFVPVSMNEIQRFFIFLRSAEEKTECPFSDGDIFSSLRFLSKAQVKKLRNLAERCFLLEVSLNF